MSTIKKANINDAGFFAQMMLDSAAYFPPILSE